MSQFWRTWWCSIGFSVSVISLAVAQVTPVDPPNDDAGDELLILDRPEARLVDTVDAELPARAPAPPDTSAGFFRKVFQPGYPNPERAAALSLVLPGAGQIYNKRFAYIKVPVIVAGYGTLIYLGESNRKLKNRLETAYQLKLKGEVTEYDGLRIDTPENLRINRDARSKNFQLAYIGVVLFHLVQTLEAYTTAHLLNFDMDESLSLRPAVMEYHGAAGFGESRPGVALTWQLR